MRAISQETIKNLISFRLKEIRKRHNHTQDVVASHLHMCRTAYTKYELGVVLPNLPFLVEFASMYNMSISELLSDIDMAMKEE